MKKKLNQTVQCKNCPWKVNSDTSKIPGYSRDLHKGLQNTIADSTSHFIGDALPIMLCHNSAESKDVEGEELECVGWLWNQLGIGNNIMLRLWMIGIENRRNISVTGEQYEKFEDTLC